ncbi:MULTISPECIES: sulfite exporter TauE/SafE family protein [Halorubrum]|uniref:Probable membrane transporter protein n=2 Tax=Halorubrum ezzemoulense TaxID=337243 RepID=A0A256IVQ8_HALEZ|nr:permease [Halorubrum sp. SD683]OYR60197.1 permease [Halorubrum ezzemoulense]PHQ42851.1 permease [Halorubrum sp. C191]OYR61802.1 permease [Halorubrum ezzemoulense]OYR68367.1 permease [Halorubrum ezzemoulense]
MLGNFLGGLGIFETSPEMLALFVGFGLVVGVLFGFFGMGGSFLVTPALLMLDYPASVAVGSGMAFVFGTAVIATLKHHDLGQVDYKLGVIMITGTTIGIEAGRASVYYLESMGLAGGVISVAYVVLLGGVGAMVTRDALKGDDDGGVDHEAADKDLDEYEIPDVAKKIQRTVRIPPMVTLRGDVTVSVWVITAVAFSTGVLSGFLGVGGGFIRMPAMIYAIGVPVPVAVGTDLFEIVFSGGLGSYLYGQDGGVSLGIVAPLLFGSALGARVGSAATAVVDSDEIKVYFGGMLLVGALAVGIGEVGSYIGSSTLELLGLVLTIGAAVVVAFAVLYTTISSLRVTRQQQTSAAD